MAEESIFRPFYTVLVLAFGCSILVAGAAVGLRPLQEANRQLDQKKNILRAAGLYEQGVDVEQAFADIETRIVELASGEFVPESTLSVDSYNQLKAPLSDELGRALDKDQDLARLNRVEKYSLVYLVEREGRVDQVILPVRGKGLWSTMYAYVSLDGDLNTIRGISFYAHGETPGLGGEVENPGWLEGWQGKKVYDQEAQVALKLVKGKAQEDGVEAPYQVDGLSGATITANGVTMLLQFWFGEHGFQPFIERMQSGGGLNG